MYGPPGVVAEVGERTRRALIRKRAGPPRPFEEPKVPTELEMLRRRREPLVERLEKVKASANLQLSQMSRDIIDEAIDVLNRVGWDR